MKSFTTSTIFLLTLLAIPCLARSSKRLAPSRNANRLSVSPAERTIPPRVPYDIEYDSDSSLRITRYAGPHISSDSLLPCMVEMMTSAFSAVWKQKDQHPKLDNHEYTCMKNGFDLKIKGTQVTVPLEYPDLVTIGNMIMYFQQTFVTPGLTFEYWFKGQQIGEGSAEMLYASNVTQCLSQI